MHSNSGEEQEDDRLNECVERFEHMLTHDGQYYFDVADLEELIEHYMETMELEKAWKVLELADQQHPHSSEFELKRADILLVKGEYAEAMRSIALLEPIMPNNPDMLVIKGGIFSRLGNHESAIQTLEHALEVAEHKGEVRIMLSYEYMKLDNTAAALNQLKAGLRESPIDQALIYEISFVFERMNDQRGAIEFFTKFLDDHPYEYNAWYNMATFHIQLREFEQAVWALEFCLAVNDKHLMALPDIADCLLELENWDKAEEYFNEMLTIDEEWDEARIGIAECAEGRGELDLAFARYQELANEESEFSDAWYGMAVVREKQERYDESLTYVLKALEHGYNDPDYWGLLADLKEHAGEYDEAVEAFDKAQELEPDGVHFLVSKALVLFNHIDRELGIETLMEAIKVKPEDAELHYRESAFLLASGQTKEALSFLQNGLELDYHKHLLLFEQYPEAVHHPRVMDLIQIYGQ